MDTFQELYKVNEEKAINGVPITVGLNRNNEEVVLYVAEAGNPNHEKVQRRYSKILEATRRDKYRQDYILAKIVAEAILVDWKGVLDLNGDPVPCTLDNKIEALTAYKKLFFAVMEAAMDETNFKDEMASAATKDTEKN